MLLYAIGSIREGEAPSIKFSDTQVFVASVEMPVLYSLNWDDCVCRACALGKEGACGSCSFLKV